MNTIFKHSVSFVLLSLYASTSFAHTGNLPTDGLADGFTHPFLGLDHLLVMLGIGLWAATQTRRDAGQSIALFVVFMFIGAVSGMAGFSFLYNEAAILVSLTAIGLLLVFGQMASNKWLYSSLIIISASVHGLAHGAEMPGSASAYQYVLGIVSATGLLHAIGYCGGLALARVHASALVRLYGGLTGALGAWLLFTSV